MPFYPFTPKVPTDTRINNATRNYGFTGVASAGAITLTGVKVGDIVKGVANATDGTNDSANFETVITVANQIQQTSASNLSTKKFVALVVAQS